MTTNLYSEIIKCLVDQPAINVNAKGIGGKTPLHSPIELDELSLLNVLLSKKNVNPFTFNNEGKTSLDYAKEGEKNKILKALINNKYGHEEDNLLHSAAITKQM
ncbi:MAG: ankyrin repeat domain-containing protein [Wolbachia endosymbiont of Fragariocoptes setiger]|nr:ankyrin repeat domain-containing protein [Wolbachia endosymbiont of Fragariocoptes setiger]